MKNLITLYKERDLGELISDSFKLIKEESKNFFPIFIKITWIYILIVLAGNAFTLLNFSDPTKLTNIFAMFGGTIISGVTNIILYAVSFGVVLFYLKAYNENEGNVTYEYVKTNVYKRIWSLLGLGFLIYLIIFVSAFFFLLPAIYFAITFSTCYQIMILEDKTASEAISDSFKLIKDHWWVTFGVLIVITVLFLIISSVFNIPTILYQFISMGTMLRDFGNGIDAYSIFSDPIYVTLNMISILGSTFINVLATFAFAMVYFDLHEIKYKTGISNQIDNIGS
ncbi:hypothetical protein [Aureivirga marina]|uniref:hypothetical protein n=1 Tax=Aureivirga marina TaxID=1182451 RepID=UPI0018CAC9FE|nr:hypothetical protein [Aureivirga marina]